MSRYRIRITSGQHTGRYVGSNLGSGLMTESELIVGREERVPGTAYSMYAKMRSSGEYLQGHAEVVQTQLKNLAYDSEFVGVDALDALAELSLSVQNIEGRILRACQVKLKESCADRVYLFFEADENDCVVVEKETTAKILKGSLALIRTKGYDRISRSGCGSGAPYAT